MPRFYDAPFAELGTNREAIPEDPQVNGSISYEEGYGPNYQIDQVASPATALDIGRLKMNQLFYDITLNLKALQEEGIVTYDPLYDYLVDGVTKGSDGILYQALIANGPSSTVVNPVGDLTGTWKTISQSALRVWDNLTDYVVGDYVTSSVDNLIYSCFIANGPGTGAGVKNPGDGGSFPWWLPFSRLAFLWTASGNYQASDIVRDSVGWMHIAKVVTGPLTGNILDPALAINEDIWRAPGGDIWSWESGTNYPLGSYVKGSDKLIYRATVLMNPGNPIDPVGDVSGSWIYVSGLPVATASGKKTIFYFGDDDPAFVLDSRTARIRMTITGGGGSGGGITGVLNQVGLSVGGGGGGTRIGWLSAPFGDTSYAIEVGAGGSASGVGGTGSFGGQSTILGNTGALSLFSALGGTPGGVGQSSTASLQLPGAVGGGPGLDGGLPTNDVIGLSGGPSGNASSLGFDDHPIMSSSGGGGSYWGTQGTGPMGSGFGRMVTNPGCGSYGGKIEFADTAGFTSQNGRNGIVIIEEFFA